MLARPGGCAQLWIQVTPRPGRAAWNLPLTVRWAPGLPSPWLNPHISRIPGLAGWWHASLSRTSLASLGAGTEGVQNFPKNQVGGALKHPRDSAHISPAPWGSSEDAK